jgi:hypothetical protein
LPASAAEERDGISAARIVEVSAARVACAPIVGDQLVGIDPVSSWALLTVPETVSVSVPAVGVNVRLTRFSGPVPVPTSGPAVEVPLSVTVPVPVKLSV